VSDEGTRDEEALQLAQVLELTEHIRSVVIPNLNSRRDLAARHYSAAALARCTRLLLAMVDLRATGFPDVVGVLLRPFLECWYLGMYFVLEPEEAHRETRAAHAHQLSKLDPEHWGDTEQILSQITEPPRALNWRNVSDRVGTLFEQRGYRSVKETTDSLYKTLYQGESAMSVHAGAATLIGHFDEVSEASFGVREIRLEPDDGLVRILTAAPLLETLARAVCGLFGISISEIDRLGPLFAGPSS